MAGFSRKNRPPTPTRPPSISIHTFNQLSNYVGLSNALELFWIYVLAKSESLIYNLLVELGSIINLILLSSSHLRAPTRNRAFGLDFCSKGFSRKPCQIHLKFHARCHYPPGFLPLHHIHYPGSLREALVSFGFHWKSKHLWCKMARIRFQTSTVDEKNFCSFHSVNCNFR